MADSAHIWGLFETIATVEPSPAAPVARLTSVAALLSLGAFAASTFHPSVHCRKGLAIVLTSFVDSKMPLQGISVIKPCRSVASLGENFRPRWIPPSRELSSASWTFEWSVAYMAESVPRKMLCTLESGAAEVAYMIRHGVWQRC